MDDPDIAEKLVKALHHPEGDTSLRPVHSLGIGASGSFVASDVASQYCKADHFKLFDDPEGDDTASHAGKSEKTVRTTPVTIRFSNASGSAIRRDGWSDVRGMATRFHLADGSATDLIAMTLPEFFTPTDTTFYDFAVDAYPKPFSRESPWRKILDLLRMTIPMRNPYPGEKIRPDEGAISYADKEGNAFAQLAVFQAASIGAPESYVRASYHAVHTFIVTAPDGAQRWVRFTWQPIDGVLNRKPEEPPEDDYLDGVLRERLAKGPARFSLMMTIGETGDAFDDPTRPWPPHRARVMMGTLTVEKVLENQLEECERLSFNPGLLTEGIEPSGDNVLRVRKEAYALSSEWRHATPCPFSGS